MIITCVGLITNATDEVDNPSDDVWIYIALFEK